MYLGRKLSATLLTCVLALSLNLFGAPHAHAGSTGSAQLLYVQGGGAPTSSGDYIAAEPPGLNTYYSFFVEVPPGLPTLQVDLFDADVGQGGAAEAAANRDRARVGFNTTAIYQLLNPGGGTVANFFGTAGFCSGGACDNTWTNLSTVANPAAGHWEVRVNTSFSSGDDLNAFGIRAHDGTPGAGGTELRVYYHSFGQYGTNSPSLTRNYTHHPFITSGCTASLTEFDWDSNSGSTGSVTLTDRTGTFSDNTGTLSANDVWQSNGFGPWTTDDDATGYGAWGMDVSITGYFDGVQPAGNYGVVYIRNSAGAAPPPVSQPQANSFRVYLPTDAGAAPSLPYLEQQIRGLSGPNPPQAGQTTTYAVTVRMANPSNRAVTFSAPSNLITAHVPGSGAVYGGNAQVTQGSVTSQPAVGGTGNVVWNPGTLAAGATALLVYEVDITPAGAGQRVVATGTPASNGTRGTYLDATGTRTYAQGPLCELAATENIPTHALLESFSASAAGGALVLEWSTTSEVGTSTFELYRLDEETGRYRAVTERPLPGRIDAPYGAVYRLVDPEASPRQPPTYFLLETDLGGRQRFFGPYRPEVSWTPGREAPVDGFEARSRRPDSPRPMPSAASSAGSSTDSAALLLETRRPGRVGALKVGVRESGFHRLTTAEIAVGFGVSPAAVRRWIERRRLRLSVGGREAAWTPDPWTGGDGLLFYGEAPEDSGSGLFSRERIYRLELGPGRGVGMGTVPADPRGTVRPEGLGFASEIHREKNTFPVTVISLDPRSDHWFWAGLLAGSPSVGSATLPFAAPDPALASAAEAELRLGFQSASTSGVAGEHTARVSLNGVFLGETSWEGIRRHQAAFPFAPSLLSPDGGNELTVEAGVVDGVAQSAFYADDIDLAYPRLYRASEGRLDLAGEAREVVTVRGFDSPDILVFDVTGSLRPRLLTGVDVAPEGGGHRASFLTRRAGSAYLALDESAVLPPATLTVDHPSNLTDPANRGEYLVIAPASLAAGAEALADHRRADGFETRTVELEDVWDEMSASQPDPEALRAFLALARESWELPPRYVVLVGDGSLDARNLLGFGDGLLPSVLVETPFGLYASDLAYGDLEGNDGVPEIAVGRIPGRTNAEVRDYVARLAEYEALSTAPEDPSRRLLLVADNPDRGADFALQNDRLADRLGDRLDLLRLPLGPVSRDQVRDEIFSAASDGTLGLLHYTGHGGASLLAEEKILELGDVGSLTAPGSSPFALTALTCALNRFEVPGFATLSEELLLAEHGGVVAAWAPSGLSYHQEAEALARGLFDTLASPEAAAGEIRLGDAVRRALAAYRSSDAVREMQQIYNLLGDPALRLRVSPPLPAPPSGGGGEGPLE